MTLSESESVPNRYDVYYSVTGDRYIEISELSILNIHTDSPLVQFTETYYQQIEVAYWMLVIFLILYLTMTFVFAPLFYGYIKNRKAVH